MGKREMKMAKKNKEQHARILSNILDLAESQGYTQNELALNLGFSKTMVTKWKEVLIHT